MSERGTSNLAWAEEGGGRSIRRKPLSENQRREGVGGVICSLFCLARENFGRRGSADGCVKEWRGPT